VVQKHVIDYFKKELTLILDTKTRWIILLDMLERFYRLLISILKSLIAINSSIQFSETEIKLLEGVIGALQPVKFSVEAICREDANLFTADITFNFMLDEL
jgi:phage-related minor tail protein